MSLGYAGVSASSGSTWYISGGADSLSPEVEPRGPGHGVCVFVVAERRSGDIDCDEQATHKASEAGEPEVVSICGDVRDQGSISRRGITDFYLCSGVSICLEENSERRSKGWLGLGPAPANVVT